jgi:hypothetical protein
MRPAPKKLLLLASKNTLHLTLHMRSNVVGLILSWVADGGKEFLRVDGTRFLGRHLWCHR